MTTLRRRLLVPVSLAVLSLGATGVTVGTSIHFHQKAALEEQAFNARQTWTEKKLAGLDRLEKKCPDASCKQKVQDARTAFSQVLGTHEQLVKNSNDFANIQVLLAVVSAVCTVFASSFIKSQISADNITKKIRTENGAQS